MYVSNGEIFYKNKNYKIKLIFKIKHSVYFLGINYEKRRLTKFNTQRKYLKLGMKKKTSRNPCNEYV